MSLQRLLASIGLVLLGSVIGIVAATESPSTRNTVTEFRRTAREALGLPKRWRIVPDPTDRRGRIPLPCPDPAASLVIVTGGQSNAANFISGPAISTDPGDRVYTFFDGACFATADPVLGASGYQASLWPALGQKLAAEAGRPVVFVHGAIGSTQAADWLDPRSGYLAALEARVTAIEATGETVDWILWHQGETDAAVKDSAAGVVADFTALTQRLLAGRPEARLYLFRASRCQGSGRINGVPFIREGLTRVAEANPQITAGMNTDIFNRDGRWDGCHFNSFSRARIVETVAQDLLAPR